MLANRLRPGAPKALRRAGRPHAAPQRDKVPEMVAQLEEDIVFARLAPGARLVEHDLAARFATHRAAVRQALFELDLRGLVERIPNRGAVVRSLGSGEIRQIYAVREQLEVMAARTIAFPVDPAALRELAEIQRRHHQAVEAGDLRVVFHSNIEFHRRMFALCGNPFLIEAIEMFAQKAYPIRSYSHTDRAYLEQVRRDHVEMLAALRRGDRERLVKLCAQHLQPSRDAYIRARSQREDGRIHEAAAAGRRTR